MTKPVRLAREARDELHNAARRYGEVRPELRAEFLAAIDEALARLVRMARHLGSPAARHRRSARAHPPRVRTGLPVLAVLRGVADPIPRAGGRPRSQEAVLLAQPAMSTVSNCASASSLSGRTSD